MAKIKQSQILEITEVHDHIHRGDSFDIHMEGYLIRTEHQKIYLLIDQDDQCCETFGYLSSPDDLQSFVGSTLLEANEVDVLKNKKEFESRGLLDLEDSDSDTMFIQFLTDKGEFELAVYNYHNGYYGHHVEFDIVDNDKVQ